MFEHDAELHNWRLDESHTPGRFIVRGRIYKDSKHRSQDGEPVRTSLLVTLENGHLTTLNTKYLLVNS